MTYAYCMGYGVFTRPTTFRKTSILGADSLNGDKLPVPLQRGNEVLMEAS